MSEKSMDDGATIVRKPFNDPLPIVERSAERSGNDAPTISEASQSPSEVKPKGASLRRAGPIPPDWQPDREFARRKGLSAGEIAEQEQRFRDHAAANRRLQADWDASWRNWVTSPYQRAGPVIGHAAAPRSGSREDTRERTIRALRALDPIASADDARPSQSAHAKIFGLVSDPEPA
jgi:hypothetical protein